LILQVVDRNHQLMTNSMGAKPLESQQLGLDFCIIAHCHAKGGRRQVLNPRQLGLDF